MQDFENECQAMGVFGGKTKHIIQMYGYSKDELGQGSYEGDEDVPGLDPLGQKVQRVFLDYCDAGDMDDYSRRLYKQYTAENPIPEKIIWLVTDYFISHFPPIHGAFFFVLEERGRTLANMSVFSHHRKLFLCLAQGCAMLENGDENLSGDPVFDEDLNCVHFDMKNENVFIKTTDDEHKETPLLVIGDLGLIQIMAKPPMSNSQYRLMQKIGTIIALPPEQYESSYVADFGIKQYLGTGINIWGIGKIMHHLITRARECNPQAYFNVPLPYQYMWTQLDTEDAESWVMTQGPLLLEAPYSYQLRRIVLKCLAMDYNKRPSARELLGVITRALGEIERVEGVAGGDEMDLDVEMESAAENLGRLGVGDEG
ncbi:hypothetical protein HYFRA_00011669 [Hymenoscyphus fraxineus]|uniref:non-specific serine/threonine protein kinase n=1 Tax=Hymenoscyphus fraxineus TaxID=746836 RepID=A0A9N9L149_9HELO|nr:hypothetical protein HYFRA_00011669 [Hymenoscyphus fraxineus]